MCGSNPIRDLKKCGPTLLAMPSIEKLGPEWVWVRRARWRMVSQRPRIDSQPKHARSHRSFHNGSRDRKSNRRGGTATVLGPTPGIIESSVGETTTNRGGVPKASSLGIEGQLPDRPVDAALIAREAQAIRRKAKEHKGDRPGLGPRRWSEKEPVRLAYRTCLTRHNRGGNPQNTPLGC